ncbi:ATP-dependent RNA helicase dbp7, partial [Cladochytrium tenue]
MNDSDDDGIQLNLAGTSSSTDVPGARRLRPTAGSWKQRSAERKQRQQQQHRPAGHPTTMPAGAAASASVSAVVRHGPPAAKAAAVTSKAPAARNSRPPAADHDAPANPKQPQTQSQQRRGHFVTSLFTSNPELKPIGARAAPAVERPAGTFRDLSTLVARDAASFTDLGLHPRLAGHLASAMDATRPTPIQRAALARLLGAHSSSLSSSFAADVCLEARTGSGKTLAFLLPVIHWLVRCEEEVGAGVRLDRGLGTLAVVLAPTRELAKQTYDVLERLLRYPSGRGGDVGDSGDTGGGGGSGGSGARLGHWIVGSLVVGGEKKKSEKARLRKGATILVSTPGRLLDHLKTTKAFAVENLRWVVLDEADRLLDLGFETAVKEILQLLDERRQLAVKQGTRLKISCWPRDRQVLLASATLKQGVVDLADSILRSPVVLRESEQQQQQNPAAQSSVVHPETSDSAPGVAATAASGDDAFAVPSSLKQKYTVVPLKLRLVSLIALLRGMALDKTKAFKAIVFVYTRDIADFLFHAVTKGLDAAVAAPPRGRTVAPVAAFADGDGSTAAAAQEPPVRKFGDRTAAPALDEASVASVVDNAVLGGVQVVRLHGEMAQALRTRAYAAFAGARRGVLFCTDVAARGLDLPDVSDVVQYDQPCELADYIHRVGRTARFGRRGNAVSLLLP